MSGVPRRLRPRTFRHRRRLDVARSLFAAGLITCIVLLAAIAFTRTVLL